MRKFKVGDAVTVRSAYNKFLPKHNRNMPATITHVFEDGWYKIDTDGEKNMWHIRQLKEFEAKTAFVCVPTNLPVDKQTEIVEYVNERLGKYLTLRYSLLDKVHQPHIEANRIGDLLYSDMVVFVGEEREDKNTQLEWECVNIYNKEYLIMDINL